MAAVSTPVVARRARHRLGAGAAAAAVAALLLCAVGSPAAQAVTTIDGPVGLGTAATFGVLGAAAVTNTGPSSIGGDLGVSPGTSITGFPPGISSLPTTATVAAQAQADTATAYGVAASLSPTTSGLTDLVGKTLAPGVYSGGALSLSGTVTLDGSADSVWVFQAASSLITSSGSSVHLTGGASSCNVFWQVGSSATLGSGSTMVGTVMALASISTGSGTTVAGRLLARTGAVSLINTSVVPPSSCTPDAVTGGTVTASPTITSGAPAPAVVGSPYSFEVSVTATGTTTLGVSDGSLPPGLALDSTTGMITGTPTAPGSYPVTVTADNGVGPAASADYVIVVRTPQQSEVGGVDVTANPGVNELAATGSDTPGAAIPVAIGGLLAGLALLVLAQRRGRRADIFGE